MKAPATAFPHQSSIVFPDSITEGHLTSMIWRTPFASFCKEDHVPMSRKPGLLCRNGQVFSMERGKKETPASDRSSTHASYPAPCGYFKAELHPVTGGHQTRDLSHVRNTGCLPQQSLGDERGLVHHCWKFQFVPTRRKKSVCLRKPGVNTAKSPVRSVWLWANYPVPLNSCKKAPRESLLFGDHVSPRSHHF